MSAAELWQCGLPPVNRREALRYAGVKQSVPEMENLLDECIALCENSVAPRLCHAMYPVQREGNVLDLGFARVESAALGRCLAGCSRLVLFAATIGLEMDRLTARQMHLSPARSVMLQGIGTERIEALCDAFEDELIRRGFHLRPRFSPGYGDVPLEMQREIFAALDCPRNIGLTLNESLLMSPAKSVTAIIGLSDQDDGGGCAHNCAACSLPECLYRR